MKLNSVMAETKGNVPLPEGIHKNHPFATDKVHPKSNPKFKTYMLEHPCYAFRALEFICDEVMENSRKELENTFGVKINHVILDKQPNGSVETIELLPSFIGTYFGILSPILGTSVARTWNQIKLHRDATVVQREFPIGFTKLETHGVIFGGHVPVFTNVDHFTDIAHVCAHVIKQEMRQRFIYAVYPYIDKNTENTPIIHLNADSKRTQALKDLLKKKNMESVNIDWGNLVIEFQNNIVSALSNEVIEKESPITKLYENLITQTDSMSFARAISMIASNAHKTPSLNIVPERNIMIVPIPDVPTSIRLEQVHKEIQAELARKSLQQGQLDYEAISRGLG